MEILGSVSVLKPFLFQRQNCQEEQEPNIFHFLWTVFLAESPVLLELFGSRSEPVEPFWHTEQELFLWSSQDHRGKHRHKMKEEPMKWKKNRWESLVQCGGDQELIGSCVPPERVLLPTAAVRSLWSQTCHHSEERTVPTWQGNIELWHRQVKTPALFKPSWLSDANERIIHESHGVTRETQRVQLGPKSTVDIIKHQGMDL